MVNSRPRILDHDKPVVGMVHLLPLPGSPRYGGSRDRVRSAALRDAALEGATRRLVFPPTSSATLRAAALEGATRRERLDRPVMQENRRNRMLDSWLEPSGRLRAVVGEKLSRTSR